MCIWLRWKYEIYSLFSPFLSSLLIFFLFLVFSLDATICFCIFHFVLYASWHQWKTVFFFLLCKCWKMKKERQWGQVRKWRKWRLMPASWEFILIFYVTSSIGVRLGFVVLVFVFFYLLFSFFVLLSVCKELALILNDIRPFFFFRCICSNIIQSKKCLFFFFGGVFGSIVILVFSLNSKIKNKQTKSKTSLPPLETVSSEACYRVFGSPLHSLHACAHVLPWRVSSHFLWRAVVT